MNPLSGRRRLWLLSGHTALLTHMVPSTSSIVNKSSSFMCHFGIGVNSWVTVTHLQLHMPLSFKLATFLLQMTSIDLNSFLNKLRDLHLCGMYSI